MNLWSGSNNEVGRYKYFIEARNIDVDLEQVRARYEFDIIINPCWTAKTSAPQVFPVQVLEYKMDNLVLSWDHFEQFPACNYTWKYTVVSA